MFHLSHLTKSVQSSSASALIREFQEERMKPKTRLRFRNVYHLLWYLIPGGISEQDRFLGKPNALQTNYRRKGFQGRPKSYPFRPEA